MAPMDRRNFLGASDIAAILGLSPWRTPWEIWAEKTGRLDPRPAGAAADAGNILEQAVLQWAESEIGPIEPGGEVAIPGTPILCHPDGRTAADSQPVEAKTSGITGPIYGHWGDPGTDDIPEYYRVQARVQIAALHAEVCFVPSLLGGKGFRLYKVFREAEPEAHIIEQACQWWERHVKRDVPPAQTTPPPLEILKKLRRVPRKVTTVPLDLVQQHEIFLQAAREANKKKEQAEAALVAALQDAEAAYLPDGRMITYYEQHRRGYQVPECTFRILRITKGLTHGQRDDSERAKHSDNNCRRYDFHWSAWNYAYFAERSVPFRHSIGEERIGTENVGFAATPGA